MAENKIKKEDEAVKGYCVKCKEKREMENPTEVSMKGKGGKKRAAMTGTCVKCGTKMFRIMGLKK
ncbi:MAG: DUF5679 domain-containing protein [Patescibacteria group bacterium]